MAEPSSYRPPRRNPHRPGVYRFRDADGRVIYVGKAKNLRNRLNSYFASPQTLSRRLTRWCIRRRAWSGPWWRAKWNRCSSNTWIKEFSPRLQHCVPRSINRTRTWRLPSMTCTRARWSLAASAVGRALFWPVFAGVGDSLKPWMRCCVCSRCVPARTACSTARRIAAARACSAISISVRRRAWARLAPRSIASWRAG